MSAMTFYGGQSGVPRVCVLPGLIEAFRPEPRQAAAWRDLREASRQLSPVLLRWCFWHGVAMLCKLGPSPSLCATRFPLGSSSRFDGAPPWIRRLESGRDANDTLGPLDLGRIVGVLCGRDHVPFRTGDMRYGIGADGVSDLAFAVDPEGIPPFVEDLCAFFRRNASEPWAVPVAFRQAVLLHAFPDGNGRLARYLACLHSESAGLPRHLLLPAIAGFHGVPSMRAAYGSALISSSPNGFADHLHAQTANVVAYLLAHRELFDPVEQAGRSLLTAAAFGPRLHARLLVCPSAAVTEVAAIGACSERNASRWLETFSRGGAYSFDGERFVWAALVAAMEEVSRGIPSGVPSDPPGQNVLGPTKPTGSICEGNPCDSRVADA